MPPSGYSTVSPYLVVDNPHQVIEFLKATFDAEELRVYDDGEGRIIHAEVRIDDSVIMLGGASDDWPAFASLVHVYVDDVDATFQRALDAGATAAQQPQEQEGDPDRRGSVKGPGGNTWAIATPL